MTSLKDNEFVNKCVSEYVSGKGLRTICREYGVSRNLLRSIILYNGISIRGGSTIPNLGSGQVVDYIEMYKQGIGMPDIVKDYGINEAFLSYVLRKEGVIIRDHGRKYTDNSTAFSVIDNEISAYVLGFFYADSSISHTGRKHDVDINLAYKDYDHLRRIRDWISPSRPIRERDVKCNGKLYKACRLCIASEEMVHNLIELGCYPRKSLTLTFPTDKQLPSNLLPHFMRGYFDGDGSISKNVKNPDMQLLGTEEFLTSYRGILSNYGITMTKITKPLGKRCYNWRKGGRNQLKIIHGFLYNNSHIHLERKKIIFDKIVSNCPPQR